MNTTVEAPQAPVEAAPLAQEMHAAFSRAVGDYALAFKYSLQEAMAAAEQPLTPEQQARLLKGSGCGLSWRDLERLEAAGEGRGVGRWQAIRQAALDELCSGHRAARTLGGSPWERAQFLALRRSLAEQWQPRGGIEWQLIDTLAQAQACWLTWLQALQTWAGSESFLDGRDGSDGLARPPRLTTAEGLDRAAAMCDRFNRIALRTLRALCELRRRTPSVVVQNAGQVNVGAQQVNVAQA
jgi:hypothetical protein